MTPDGRPYHHGDLRRALLDAALDELAAVGPSALSLREVARRAGVSHAAPTHHFGDKAGLLTAIAAEGYRLLATDLVGALAGAGGFLDAGVAYVSFAVEHRGYFDVMFRPELYRADDPDLTAAREAAGAVLYHGTASVTGDPDNPDASVAAWSLVHGFATLWVNGNLGSAVDRDPAVEARRAASFLFASPGSAPRPDRPET